jgi:hypothetical protein
MIATICSSEKRPFRIAPSESGEPVSQLIDGPKIRAQVTASTAIGEVAWSMNYQARQTNLGLKP